MVWFRNNKKVQTVPCTASNKVCYSSLSPRKLKEGLWSVDLVRGLKLIHTGVLEVLPK